MRLRLGLAAGFAIGYYFGAKAGRGRYEQMRRAIERVEPLGKAVALAELGIERLRSSGDAGVQQPTLPFDMPISNN